jgi:Asp-tRNA(Asn)/Glu-tRNA(Gln) amidotransferase A subunit family amidase
MPPSDDPSALSASAARDAIRGGTLSAVALVEACLARMRAVDPVVQAWIHVDEGAARTQAALRDEEARSGKLRGPLHGIPVGIKDIFDVASMPTTAGARPWAHTLPTRDAPCVQWLRDKGAIVLGKTHTTQFAYRDPAPTRNPWNTEHTPGGSSSGSAAAVAARMVPLTLGSQTVGSVLRPAAYCGVVGYKPPHGVIPTQGVSACSGARSTTCCSCSSRGASTRRAARSVARRASRSRRSCSRARSPTSPRRCRRRHARSQPRAPASTS